MNDYPNEEALRKAHRIYLDAMRPFIIRCLKRIPGRTLEDLIKDILDCEPNDDIVNAIEINNSPHLLKKHWYDVFSKKFNADLNILNTTWLIREGRNLCAHPKTDDLDSELTRTHLFLVARLLSEIKNSDAKQAVETIRDRLFSDEVEVHPAEVENAVLKEDISRMSDKIAKTQEKKNKLKERLQDVRKRLEEVEAELINCKDELEFKSKSVAAEKAETGESPPPTNNMPGSAAQSKTRKKKLTIAERYVTSTTEEDRDEVAKKVVELRINAEGTKPTSWREIRETLGLKNDEFHKVIRHSKSYRAAVIDRIKSLRARDEGWEYSGKLDVLTGIDIDESELE